MLNTSLRRRQLNRVLLKVRSAFTTVSDTEFLEAVFKNKIVKEMLSKESSLVTLSDDELAKVIKENMDIRELEAL